MTSTLHGDPSTFMTISRLVLLRIRDILEKIVDTKSHFIFYKKKIFLILPLRR
jgi:hypothetical protein